MGQQHRKVAKRRRRISYLKRKKELVLAGKTIPVRLAVSVSKEGEVEKKSAAPKKKAAPKAAADTTKKASAKKAPAKKAPEASAEASAE